MIAKRWLDGGPKQHCCLVFPVMFTVNRVVSVFLQTAWLIMDGRWLNVWPFVIIPCVAELFVSIFRHLKLELLTQFPALNDEKYLYSWKIDISQ